MVATAYVGLAGLAYLRAREEIRAGRSARVAVGWRDVGFFADGWSLPRRFGHVLMRRADVSGGSIRLPLRASTPYRLVLRAEPTGETPARIAASLNDVPLGEVDLARESRRIGTTELSIPAATARDGVNRLTLRPLDAESFQVWLVRVEPVGP